MTYCVVCAGSCLFCIISKADWLDSGDAGKADQSRIAAQVVTGVGFLGNNNKEQWIRGLRRERQIQSSVLLVQN